MHGHQHLDIAHRVEPDAAGDFLAHQLEHQTGNFLGLLAVQEGEIRILLGRIFRHPSMAHIMGRPHNAARFRLTENFGEPHRRHRIAGQKIGQNRPRTDAGQLIGVAHQEQRGPRRQSTAQRRHERNIDHGKLIDHHQIGIERMLGPAFEATRRQHLEQPVDGQGRAAGRLAHAFGRAAGRGTQLETHFLRGQNFQQTVEQRRLAHTRTTGHDRHPAA